MSSALPADPAVTGSGERWLCSRWLSVCRELALSRARLRRIDQDPANPTEQADPSTEEDGSVSADWLTALPETEALFLSCYANREGQQQQQQQQRLQAECVNKLLARISREQTKIVKSVATGGREKCGEINSFRQYLSEANTLTKRGFHAVQSKYQKKYAGRVASDLCMIKRPPQNTPDEAKGASTTLLAPDQIDGSRALIDLGVSTGLTLVCSLLRQNWSLAASASKDNRPTPLCNEVLQTALDVLITGLPPLSLSNEANMTDIAKRSLRQINEFLTDCCCITETKDEKGSRLCQELLLALAIHRGSISDILKWINVSLNVCKRFPDVRISVAVVDYALSQIRTVTGSRPDGSLGTIGHVNRFNLALVEAADTGLVSLYEVALYMMAEVVFQAHIYSSTCLGSSNPSDAQQTAIEASQEQHLATKSLQPPRANATTNGSNSEVYIWGSNTSSQLGESVASKHALPTLSTNISGIQKVEAGLFCTFVIHPDGKVTRFGKGTYDLDLCDVSYQLSLRVIPFPAPVKAISSSRGSHGHYLAVTEDGCIYSWGHGGFGQLGHGNTAELKTPTQVLGSLSGKNVISISAGNRHSAAVTDDGMLYTWGEGDFGRIGLGDSQSRYSPTLVKDIGPVCQVSCGATHTLALSHDGRTLWSFGMGENGILGHGDLTRVYRPKVIESLQGITLQKVLAGQESSLALTAEGQIYTWGIGPCLGQGTCSLEQPLLLPRLVKDLAGIKVVDVSMGDVHCMALSHESIVYTWGGNNMGQCGLGHTLSPLLSPQRVGSLKGIPIHQISAGTQHSFAWTTLPLDRRVVLFHKPFCIDMSSETFRTVVTLLEGFGSEWQPLRSPVKPFRSFGEQESFIANTVDLLSAHFSLAAINDNKFDEPLEPDTVFSRDKAELERILYHLIDISYCPTDLVSLAKTCLQRGATLLLPDLSQRMNKVFNLLNLPKLSQGQELNLRLLLTSMDKPNVIASLLESGNSNGLEDKTFKLIQILLYRVHNDHCTLLMNMENSPDGNAQAENFSFRTLEEEKQLLGSLFSQYILANLKGISILEDKPTSFVQSSILSLQSLIQFNIQLFDQTRSILKARSGKLDELPKLLADMTLPKLLHFSLVSLYVSNSSERAPLMDILMTLQRMTSQIMMILLCDDQFRSSIGSWFPSFTDLHCLVTSVVAHGLGKILSHVLPQDDNKIFSKIKSRSLFKQGLVQGQKKVTKDTFQFDIDDLFPPEKGECDHINDLLLARCLISAPLITEASLSAVEEQLRALEGVGCSHKDLLAIVTLLLETSASVIGTTILKAKDDSSLGLHHMYKGLSRILEHLTHQKLNILSTSEDSSRNFKEAISRLLSACSFLLSSCFPSLIATSVKNEALANDLCFLFDTCLHNPSLDLLELHEYLCLSAALREESERAQPHAEALLNSCLLGKRRNNNDIAKAVHDEVIMQILFGLLSIDVTEEKRIHHMGPLMRCDNGSGLCRAYIKLLEDRLWLYEKGEITSTSSNVLLLLYSCLSVETYRYPSAVSCLFENSALEIDSSVFASVFSSGCRHLCAALDLATERAAMVIILTLMNSGFEITLENHCEVLSYLGHRLDWLEANKESSLMPICISLIYDFVNFLSMVTRPLQSFDKRRQPGGFPSQCKPCAFSSPKWVRPLLSLFSWNPSEASYCSHYYLKLRLSCTTTLENVLLACTAVEVGEMERLAIVDKVLDQVQVTLWLSSQGQPSKKPGDKIQERRRKLAVALQEPFRTLPLNFDINKSLFCKLDPPANTTVCHTPGGKGYCLTEQSIAGNKGVYIWTFSVSKETKANEGTCVGLSLHKPNEFSPRATHDMWLYGAYSGTLYHNGEVKLPQLPPYSGGDEIKARLDLGERTLSFALNDNDDFTVAFSDIPNNRELFPCVLFYNLNSWEEIKISPLIRTDLMPSFNLFSGDPNCAPAHTVAAQSLCTLVRTLYDNSTLWRGTLDQFLRARLASEEGLKAIKVIKKYILSPENMATTEKNTVFSDTCNVELSASINHLIRNILPALAVIAQIDQGYQVSGEVESKQTKKKGILIGSTQTDGSSVKVLWEGDESFSSVLISSLRPRDNLWDSSSFSSFNVDVLLKPEIMQLLVQLSQLLPKRLLPTSAVHSVIARLQTNDLEKNRSGGNETKYQATKKKSPPRNLTLDAGKPMQDKVKRLISDNLLAVPDSAQRDKRSSSLPENRMDSSNSASSASAASVEHLTNILVSSIIDEVVGKKRVQDEKAKPQSQNPASEPKAEGESPFTCDIVVDIKAPERENSLSAQIKPSSIVEVEMRLLKMIYLQHLAGKALNLLATSPSISLQDPPQELKAALRGCVETLEKNCINSSFTLRDDGDIDRTLSVFSAAQNKPAPHINEGAKLKSSPPRRAAASYAASASDDEWESVQQIRDSSPALGPMPSHRLFSTNPNVGHCQALSYGLGPDVVGPLFDMGFTDSQVVAAARCLPVQIEPSTNSLRAVNAIASWLLENEASSHPPLSTIGPVGMTEQSYLARSWTVTSNNSSPIPHPRDRRFHDIRHFLTTGRLRTASASESFAPPYSHLRVSSESSSYSIRAGSCELCHVTFSVDQSSSDHMTSAHPGCNATVSPPEERLLTCGGFLGSNYVLCPTCISNYTTPSESQVAKRRDIEKWLNSNQAPKFDSDAPDLNPCEHNTMFNDEKLARGEHITDDLSCLNDSAETTRHLNSRLRKAVRVCHLPTNANSMPESEADAIMQDFGHRWLNSASLFAETQNEDPLGAQSLREATKTEDPLAPLNSRVQFPKQAPSPPLSLAWQAFSLEDSSDRLCSLVNLQPILRHHLALRIVLAIYERVSALALLGQFREGAKLLQNCGIPKVKHCIIILTIQSKWIWSRPLSSKCPDLVKSVAHVKERMEVVLDAVRCLIKVDPTERAALLNHICSKLLLISTGKLKTASHSFSYTLKLLTELMLKSIGEELQDPNHPSTKEKDITTTDPARLLTPPTESPSSKDEEVLLKGDILLGECLASLVLSSQTTPINKWLEWATRCMVLFLTQRVYSAPPFKSANHADFRQVLPNTKLDRFEQEESDTRKQHKLSLSPKRTDGSKLLASWSDQCSEIALLTVYNGLILGTIKAGEETGNPRRLCWSAKGSHLATFSEKFITVWSCQRTDQPPSLLCVHQQSVAISALGWCSEGSNKLLIGRQDGSVSIFEACANQEELSHLKRENVSVSDLVWLNPGPSKSALELVVAYSDGVLIFSSVHPEGNTKIVKLSADSPMLTLSDWGNLLLVYSRMSSVVTVFDVNQEGLTSSPNDKEMGRYFLDKIPSIKLPHPHNVSLVDTVTKGEKLYVSVGQTDGGVAVWSVNHPSCGKEPRPKHIRLLWGQPNQSVDVLAFHRMGDLIASGALGPSGIVNIWSLSSGSVVQTLQIDQELTDLVWLSEKQLALAGYRSKATKDGQRTKKFCIHVLTLPLGAELTDLRMASAFRSALLGKGSTDMFAKTNCLRTLLCNMGSILQRFWTYQRGKLDSGSVVKAAGVLQSLLILTHVIKLEDIAKEEGMNWVWLLDYLQAIQGLRALEIRTHPRSYQVLDSILDRIALNCGKMFDKSPTDLAQELPSELPTTADSSRPSSSDSSRSTSSASSTGTSGSGPVNVAWSLESDQQLMNWAAEAPSDWQVGGKCTAYCFGEGRSGQLSSSGTTSEPKIVPEFSKARTIVCGVNSTFLISADGALWACGEGSNGRLGLGSSDDYHSPVLVSSLKGFSIAQVSASIGGDGHALVVSSHGEVFSWGDGEHGKLGHGNSERSRKPKLLKVPHKKRIVSASAGFSHTALLDSNGSVWTFGRGDDGQLGLGTYVGRKAPERVAFPKEKSEKIGLIACGGSHTICVSMDGLRVWAFGGNSHGQLGLGHCTRKCTPQVVDFLAGQAVRKVCCGESFTLFLTQNGQVLSCGKRSVTGQGNITSSADQGASEGASASDHCPKSTDILPIQSGSGATSVSWPSQIAALRNEVVVDIAAGFSHALALTSSGDVYAWGRNNFGQLGERAAAGPGGFAGVPVQIHALSGKDILQISAGSWHSVAYTTPRLPSNLPASFSVGPAASYCLTSLAPLGLPSEVPMKYSLLGKFSPSVLRARLQLLMAISELVAASWKLFPDFSISEVAGWPNADDYKVLRKSRIKSVLSPQVWNMPLNKIMQATMVQSRNYGPSVTVHRQYSDYENADQTIFSQIASQIVGIEPKELRLPGRSWKVRLVGEGADDAGGVFDDTITEMCSEVSNPGLPLRLLIPTPNARSEVGTHRDTFILNPEKNTPKDLKLYNFLGILMGVAIRTHHPIPLSLPPFVWKLISGSSEVDGDMPMDWEDLKDTDLQYANSLEAIARMQDDASSVDDGGLSSLLLSPDGFYGVSSTGSSIPLARTRHVSLSTAPAARNDTLYCNLARQQRCLEAREQSEALREGLCAMVPLPVLELMPPSVLEHLVTGVPRIDVAQLKRLARYRDLTPSDEVVNWLWDILENDFSEEEQVMFMVFVSGRSRLSSSPSDLPQRLQVLRLDRPNDGLPTAQTCFCQLRLPPYSSKAVLAERLRYAVRNCRTIDLDNYMLRQEEDPNSFPPAPAGSEQPLQPHREELNDRRRRWNYTRMVEGGISLVEQARPTKASRTLQLQHIKLYIGGKLTRTGLREEAKPTRPANNSYS